MKGRKTYGLLAFTVVTTLFVFVCSGSSANESIGGQEQKDTLLLSPPIEPSFVKDKKYHRLNEKNIDSFIQDWKGWSIELRTFSTDSVVNQAINRIMSEYPEWNQPDSSLFYSMPCCVEIRRYQGPCPTDDESIPIYEETNQALERFAYVPGFDSDKTILYMTPEIEKLLSQYLGGIRKNGERVTSIDKSREAYLRSLFYVHYGHWGGYWILYSMPKIYQLDLYDNGICADLQTSYHSGESLFVPYDTAKDVIHFDFWIE